MRSFPSDHLAVIADALESGRISLRSSPVGIGALPGMTNDITQHVFRAFETVGNDLDAKAVATVLRTAVKVREAEFLDSPKVEICWTGPETDGPYVVATEDTVKRLLESVQDNGEVLLVGYSLTVGPDSPMSEVFDLLANAARRRAKIRMVLHQDESEGNMRQLLDAWDVTARQPAIYTWDPPEDLPYTKLHAKCLVVDRLRVLVTSANFTLHGLTSNLELGLLVSNQPVAAAVHDQFDTLISDGTLREWEDAS